MLSSAVFGFGVFRLAVGTEMLQVLSFYILFSLALNGTRRSQRRSTRFRFLIKDFSVDIDFVFTSSPIARQYSSHKTQSNCDKHHHLRRSVPSH